LYCRAKLTSLISRILHPSSIYQGFSLGEAKKDKTPYVLIKKGLIAIFGPISLVLSSRFNKRIACWERVFYTLAAELYSVGKVIKAGSEKGIFT